MKNCPIYIPTYKRLEKQVTLKNLPGAFSSRHVKLVVRPSEYKDYVEKWGWKCEEVICLPAEIDRAHAVEWIVRQQQTKYAFFMDDDLVFHYRPDVNNHKLLGMKNENLFEAMFQDMLEKAESENLAHVAVSMRGGNNHHMTEWAYNTRYMRACIYDLEILNREKIELTRCPLMEDFDTELQLLRKGYKAAINHRYAQGEVAFCAPGGACDQRIAADHGRRPAEMLASLHPEFVTVIQKKTKQYKWNNGERTDVRVQWDKAYKSSQIHMVHLTGRKVIQQELPL